MTRRWRLLLCLALGACDSQPTPVPDGGTADAMADEAVDFRSPVIEAVGACDGVAGYETRPAGDPLVEWSALHTDVRFFGAHEDPFQVDAELVHALGGARARPGEVDGSDAAFADYAERVGGCFVGAWPAAGSSAVVSQDPSVRWLAPGDPVALGDATHVLVDLRNAPEGPALQAFLDALVEAALAEEVSQQAYVRAFNGMRDEAFVPLVFEAGEGLYRSRVESRTLTYGGGGHEVALGFLVGDRIAPSAARVVLALRGAGRAAIVGRGIDARVAELYSRPAARGGVLFRAIELHDETLRSVPDRFPADLPLERARVEDIERAFRALGALPPVQGPVERSELQPLPASTRVVARERHEGSRQAALIAIYGAAEVFFPYWDVVDTDSLGRLREALALPRAQDEDPGAHLVRSLRHWSYALADSHGFTDFLAERPPVTGTVGVLPLRLDLTDAGEAVVRASSHPDFIVGDVLVDRGGTPASEIMERFIRAQASSASSAARNGLRALLPVVGEQTYRLRAPDGTERDVQVQADALAGMMPPPFSTREHGPLTDLDHPDVLYVDLHRDAIAGRFPEIRAGLEEARQVVLDMRGYPGPDAWSVVRHLLYEGSSGARLVEVHQSILGAERQPIEQPWTASPHGFQGDAVILVAPSTQSQAEHLVLTLQAADRVSVVGRPSAGANGDITSLALPGEVYQSFTGMIVLQPDGSTFHGMGVRVDHPVSIEAATLADGRDPELDLALEVLDRE